MQLSWCFFSNKKAPPKWSQTQVLISIRALPPPNFRWASSTAWTAVFRDQRRRLRSAMTSLTRFMEGGSLLKARVYRPQAIHNLPSSIDRNDLTFIVFSLIKVDAPAGKSSLPINDPSGRSFQAGRRSFPPGEPIQQ